MHKSFIQEQPDQIWKEPSILDSSADNATVLQKMKKLESEVNLECFSSDQRYQTARQTQQEDTCFLYLHRLDTAIIQTETQNESRITV